MKPDDGDDKETATAEVNAKMVVSSNYNIAITPEFIEGAAAVNAAAGDNNMPFTYVDWNALQSDVVDGGATFKIQKMAMGANQEMEPTGDVAYVACGPFECVSGDSSVTAPEITSMDDESYANWDPMLDPSATAGLTTTCSLTVTPTHDANVLTDDGIDLGWITSSTLGMGVKHKFNGVPDGTELRCGGSGRGSEQKGRGRQGQGAQVLTLPDDDDTTADDDQSRSCSNTRIHRLQLRGCPDGAAGSRHRAADEPIPNDRVHTATVRLR